VIELWTSQANNVLKACDNSLEKLMGFLEFKYGKLQIKDLDVLVQYQLYTNNTLSIKR
jgi:hypothetical protein